LDKERFPSDNLVTRYGGECAAEIKFCEDIAEAAYPAAEFTTKEAECAKHIAQR
jgi:hypothetical protein